MDEGNIVNTGSNIWKKVRDLFAAFAVFVEFPFRSNHSAFATFTTTTKSFHIDGLSIERIKLWLVVKSVYVTWATIHEKKDDRFGLTFIMRLLGC